MSTLTPRQQLTERVTARFVSGGMEEQLAYANACTAVNAFYNEEYDFEHWNLVAQEAVQLVIEIMPPAVTHMRAAFEQVNRAIASVTQAAVSAGPFVEMAIRLKRAEGPSNVPPKFDASGLPAVDHPREDAMVNLTINPDRRGEPCIEEGCEEDAVPGTAFCRMCTPEPSDYVLTLRSTDDHEPPENIADEVSLADTGRPWVHFQQFTRPVVSDGEPGPVVVMHLTDRITGAPHHYIVNGDHSACFCGGHSPECTTWDSLTCAHAPTICNVARTLCQHQPRHLYRDPCEHDPHVSPMHRPPVVGHTDGGDEVRGPVAG